MELASMLAGERFSDAPESVCPVVADFMRTYSDLVDDDGRADSVLGDRVRRMLRL